MTQVFSASGRITQPYTISSRLHRLHVFVRNIQASGGNYNINSRTSDLNDLPWHDAANGLLETLTYLLPAATPYGDAILEKYTGGVYIVQDTYTATATDHGGGTAGLGWQGTLVLRDTLFEKLKVVILEGQFGLLAHYASYGTIPGGAFQQFVKQWMSVYTVTHAPYLWAVSQGDQYINTSPFVGLTCSTNRRVRRARGLT